MFAQTLYLRCMSQPPLAVWTRVQRSLELIERIVRMTELDSKLLQQALSGDQGALRVVIAELTPVVRARVARVIGRQLGFTHARFSHEVADCTQEVFMFLFTDHAKALRAWDAGRGLSFLNFVGLLAQRKVAEIVRTRRWRAHSEELVLDDSQLAPLQRDEESGEQLSQRELMQRALTHLERTLSLRAREMFERLYVQEQSVEEVCTETGLSADAVYQWRSRLAKAAREAFRALEQNHTVDAPATLAARGSTGGRWR
jgi:RNA polymerase sigma-70 factor (ECF subfamily)